MRKIVRLYLGLSVFIALVSPAIAELAMTGAPVTMRAAPTGNAGVVERIPQSVEIDVEKCVRAWCRASWHGRFGYVPAQAVVLRSPLATLPRDKMRPRSSTDPRQTPRRRLGYGQAPTSASTGVLGLAPGSADRF
jgi:uncharacterized protein YraI